MWCGLVIADHGHELLLTKVINKNRTVNDHDYLICQCALILSISFPENFPNTLCYYVINQNVNVFF